MNEEHRQRLRAIVADVREQLDMVEGVLDGSAGVSGDPAHGVIAAVCEALIASLSTARSIAVEASRRRE